MPLSLLLVHLWCCMEVFFSLSPNHALHIIINGTAIWGVRQPDVRGDVVGEIFSQPTLGSPACVAWYRVLLLGKGSSNNHPLDPGQHYLPLALDVGLSVESEAM